MTCSRRFSEFGGLITRNNEGLGSEIAIKTTRSSHVETVCLLSNRKSKPDSYVDLSINMEESCCIPIAPSLYSLSNKMGNSLLAVRDINHIYIVVEMILDILSNYVKNRRRWKSRK